MNHRKADSKLLRVYTRSIQEVSLRVRSTASYCGFTPAAFYEVSRFRYDRLSSYDPLLSSLTEHCPRKSDQSAANDHQQHLSLEPVQRQESRDTHHGCKPVRPASQAVRPNHRRRT